MQLRRPARIRGGNDDCAATNGRSPDAPCDRGPKGSFDPAARPRAVKYGRSPQPPVSARSETVKTQPPVRTAAAARPESVTQTGLLGQKGLRPMLLGRKMSTIGGNSRHFRRSSVRTTVYDRARARNSARATIRHFSSAPQSRRRGHGSAGTSFWGVSDDVTTAATLLSAGW